MSAMMSFSRTYQLFVFQNKTILVNEQYHVDGMVLF